MLNGNTSDVECLYSGIPQSSILYTSSFPEYIINCSFHFYTDDTHMYYSFKASQADLAEVMINGDLNNLACALMSHLVHLNVDKSVAVVLS